MADKRPFLEVLTRCYKRPHMLCANEASLDMQTAGDWVQTLIVDDVGIGVAAANAKFSEIAPDLEGEWIWVLDDDDYCIDRSFVEELRWLVDHFTPDVVMVKMDHGENLGVLPDEGYWGRSPQCGHIGCSAYVMHRSLWQRHAFAWACGRYDADYEFIKTVWEDQPRVIWHDKVVCACQRISRGAAE